MPPVVEHSVVWVGAFTPRDAHLFVWFVRMEVIIELLEYGEICVFVVEGLLVESGLLDNVCFVAKLKEATFHGEVVCLRPRGWLP